MTTVPNQKYTLTFFVGNVSDPGGIFGTTSTVNVLVNGVQVFTATNSISSKKAKFEQVWKKFKTTITASSSTTAIAFMNGDPSNDTLNGLDEVRLVATSASTRPPARDSRSRTTAQRRHLLGSGEPASELL